MGYGNFLRFIFPDGMFERFGMFDYFEWINFFSHIFLHRQ